LTKPGENWKDIPCTIDEFINRGILFCGSPTTVNRQLEAALKVMPIDYLWLFTPNELLPQKMMMKHLDLMTRQVTEYFGQQPDGSYQTRAVNSWPSEPLKRELESFAHAIRTGEAPAVTGEDGLRNLEVALRCLGEG